MADEDGRHRVGAAVRVEVDGPQSGTGLPEGAARVPRGGLPEVVADRAVGAGPRRWDIVADVGVVRNERRPARLAAQAVRARLRLGAPGWREDLRDIGGVVHLPPGG